MEFTQWSGNIKTALELKRFLDQFDDDTLRDVMLQLEIYESSNYGGVTRHVGNSEWLDKGVNVELENRSANPFLALEVLKSTTVGS